MTIEELKKLLFKFHIKPDRRMGQNFLLSDEVVEKIIETAELEKTDTVLEIGPGFGILTRALGEKAGRVFAMEKDAKMCEALHRIFRNYKHIKIIRGDALDLKVGELIKPRFGIRSEHELTSYKVVANIPYYLTGKIIRDFLQAQNKPHLLILMLQKEVAERIVAKAGEMSLLSVSVQFYADAEIVVSVPRENFYPKPQVDSAVVKIRPRRALLFSDINEEQFFRLVKLGYSNKRKQLHNNLSAGLGKKFDIKSLITELGFRKTVRPQELSLNDWYALYKKLSL